MYTKLLPLLILPLFSIFVYATDLNNTEAILTQASEATQPIQAELNAILEENSPQEAVIVEEKSIEEPIVKEPIQEQPAPIQEEPYTNPETTPLPEESNNTIEEKTVVVNSVETTVENNQEIQEETNTTTIIEEPSAPTVPSEENNESEVKKPLNLTKGNSQKGKRIFIKHLKQKCDTTAYKFAGNYAQEEWEEIAESGKFKETIIKLCPNISESYNENWSSDLYQFFYEHANDTENIPEC